MIQIFLDWKKKFIVRLLSIIKNLTHLIESN